MRYWSVFLLLLIVVGQVQSQTATVSGKIVDARKSTPLAGVHIRLLSQSDSTNQSVTATDTGGHFFFPNVRKNSFTLEATYLGYKKFEKIIEVNTLPLDLGTISMSESTIPMEEIVIEGRVPATTQKGDTTEYNARAFKVNKDATAEDLVTKMPGVIVDNGNVKAQGEDVQQVLVDGRPFFGADPTLALRNLPSEIVDKVQVFDKLSDQAQLTGFDDGQTVKTMNIVTRQDRRQGQFGRVNGGYGTDDRYIATGNMNSFHADQRLSIIGLSNNVNQQNFSTQDLLGVTGGSQRGGFGGGGIFGRGRRSGANTNGTRGGGGGGPQQGEGNVNNFLVGQQNGISTAHSLGSNYADSIGRNVYANGSYFFNLTDNNNPQNLSRQYILSQDSSSLYSENSQAEKKNSNHRFNFRFEYTPDSANTIIAAPQLFYQNNRSTSSVDGTNTSASQQVVSQSNNDNLTTANGFTSQNHLTLRHKFSTPGRTISVDVGVGLNHKRSTGTLHSLDQYFDTQMNANDTINQQTGILTNGYSLSSSLAYTEPLSINSLLQINFSPAFSKTKSDNRTYNYNPSDAEYSDLNMKLSNSFDNRYTTANTGIGYRLRGKSFNATAGVSFQVATLRSEQSFPNLATTEKSFYSILPNMMFNYELANRRGLRFMYRASTSSPSISQLQNVLDNSNPLLLSTGNPDLRQSYTHSLLTRLTLSNTENAQSILLFFFANYTHDYIANSTLIAQRDTVLPGGLRLNQGTQLTIPVNLDGYWNLRSFCTYGFPFDFLKSNLNFNGGLSYTRTPGMVNSLKNISNVYTMSPGFVLGSNISEDLDFTLSYTGNFNIAHNSVQSDLNNNYFTHTAGVKFNWIFWEGVVLRTDMNNVLYNGLSAGLNQNYILWNIGFGKKFLPGQRGEVLLTVYDVLNQNRNINRTVTETYVEDATTKVLSRYLMLTFTYNVRQFQEMN